MDGRQQCDRDDPLPIPTHAGQLIANQTRRVWNASASIPSADYTFQFSATTAVSLTSAQSVTVLASSVQLAVPAQRVALPGSLASPCAPGEFISASEASPPVCTPCPTGKHAALSGGLYSCLPCEVRSCWPWASLSAVFETSVVQAGLFASSLGSANCSECTIGRVSAGNSNVRQLALSQRMRTLIVTASNSCAMCTCTCVCVLRRRAPRSATTAPR
jgi:hypothetical protein